MSHKTTQPSEPDEPDDRDDSETDDASLSDLFGLDPPISGPAGPDPLIGEIFGDARIICLLGSGGMGRVYEAFQDQLGRTVAVKVMRPGLATPEMQKRFKLEALVIARLEHPGIARIYGAGVRDWNGATVPYFVMELVPDALPITDYARERKLSTKERLTLFRGVCDAVAHGHQKGVIHRDLKPTNILVDANGEPKVIDFGVAKVTDSDLALTTMQTEVGQLIGTLHYMGPEQIAGLDAEIDVRCDVYALGVVLYELLAGRMPYDLDKKALLEVMRIVREEEPVPLSSLDRGLRRDVTVIVGKCLEKERSRRYSSASELSEDLGRHLAGEPIKAKPQTFLQASARVARKHKLAAALVTAISLSIVAGVVVISRFAIDADQERKNAEIATNEAQAANLLARRQLYRLNLAELNRRVEEGDLAKARLLHQEMVDGLKGSPLPIELRCLGIEARTNQLLFDGQAGTIWETRFSPDGARVATFSEEFGICVWDLTTGQQLSQLAGTAGDPDRNFNYDLGPLAWSSDGRRLFMRGLHDTSDLAENLGNGLPIWDAATGSRVNVVAGRPFAKIIISPAGNRLITYSGSSTSYADPASVGALSQASLSSMPVITEDWSSTDLSFWAAEYEAAFAVRHIQVWDTDKGTLIATLRRDLPSIGTIGDTSDLFGSGSQERRGVSATLDDFMASETEWFFSADGQRAIRKNEKLGDASLWDLNTGAFIAEIRLDAWTQRKEGGSTWAGHCAPAFSPDGKWVATLCNDGKVRVWDAVQGTLRAALESGREPWDGEWLSDSGATLVISPTSTHLALVSEVGRVRWWAIQSGDLVGRSEEEALSEIVFSPDGAYLVGIPSETGWRLWHAATGEVVQLPGDQPPAGDVYDLDFLGFGVGFNGSTHYMLLDDGSKCMVLGLRGDQATDSIALVCEPLDLTIDTDGTPFRVHQDGAGLWLEKLLPGVVCKFVWARAAESGDWPPYWHLCPGNRWITDGDRERVWAVKFQAGNLPFNGGLCLKDETLDWAAASVRRRRHTVAFSPDGSLFASQGKLIDVCTGAELADGEFLFCPHSGLPRKISGWGVLSARMVDANTAQHLSRIGNLGDLRLSRDSLSAAEVSQDGSTIATGARDGMVRIWSVFSSQQVRELAFKDAVRAIALSMDGKLAVALGARVIYGNWGNASWSPEQLPNGADATGSTVGGMAFSVDGTKLATGDSDGTVQIWALGSVGARNVFQTGLAEATLAGIADDWLMGDDIVQLCWSEDGTLLATLYHRMVRVFDVKTQKEIWASRQEDEGGPYADSLHTGLGFDESGDLLAWCAMSGGPTRLLSWRQDAQRLSDGPRFTLPLAGVSGLAITRDGSRVVVGQGHSLEILNRSGRPEQTIPGVGQGICIKSTADGKRLVVISKDEAIRLKTMLCSDPPHDVNGIGSPGLFSPDGSRLATQTHLWNVADGRPLAAFECDCSEIMEWSPDSSCLAIVKGRSVTVVDSGAGERRATFEVEKPIDRLMISGDAKRLFVGFAGRGTAELRDIEGGGEISAIEGATMTAIAFSPDGTRLVTAENEGGKHRLRFWDASDGKLLHTQNLYANEWAVEVLAFSPDGSRLFAGLGEGEGTYVFGASKAELQSERLATEAIQSRLKDRVQAWIDGGMVAAGARLKAAETELTPDEYGVARNMLLTALLRHEEASGN